MKLDLDLEKRNLHCTHIFNYASPTLSMPQNPKVLIRVRVVANVMIINLKRHRTVDWYGHRTK